MHFEVPKSKSLKEFGGEYLMIVISILTALALEHAVQTLHHRHVAHEASLKIESELRANVTEIDTVVAHNGQKIQRLRAVRDELLKGIQSKSDDAVLMGRFNTDWKDAVGLSIHSARLRREAWESAVASQAATWMPREDLERYSNVYAGMRDVTAISLGGGVQFLDGARFRDIMSNLQMGEASPRDMYRILNQMISAYDSIDGNLLGLRKDLIAVGQASGH